MHSLKPWYVFTDNSKDVAPGISFQLFISNPSCPNPGRREKIKLNFYFHTSLRCLKRFYEGLKGLHKTF